MSRSDLIREVAQHLEPWAWETKSFNATMARDDAMFKAEQIVDLFGPSIATFGGASTAEARILAVTSEMRRYLPNACGDWADEIENVLAMRAATPATLDNAAATEAVAGIDYAKAVLVRVFEVRGKLRDGVLASAVNMAAHRLATARATLTAKTEKAK
ncbi:hypothetical protein [uncultured Sphingomonas sp.]|uniref:hypothetical protein n=1 Tax=uncultured Sphingomonas sp. TaxID=158754 RepID=UPI0025E069B8|nr:hypothetical protein [uncultured Sphingomonas sp.]